MTHIGRSLKDTVEEITGIALELGVNGWKGRCPLESESHSDSFLIVGQNDFYCVNCGAEGGIAEFRTFWENHRLESSASPIPPVTACEHPLQQGRAQIAVAASIDSPPDSKPDPQCSAPVAAAPANRAEELDMFRVLLDEFAAKIDLLQGQIVALQNSLPDKAPARATLPVAAVKNGKPATPAISPRGTRKKRIT